ncbi:MAG: MarR family transcriptional regulator [Sporolactobacillus sp.]
MKHAEEVLEHIEYEIVNLMRRADFKKTMDGKRTSLPRSCYLILCRLLEGGPKSICDLAAGFGLDISTMSRQVQALERRQLVCRETGKANARTRLITMTAGGREVVLRLRRQRAALYGELLDDWSRDELESFAAHLAVLNERIAQRKQLNTIREGDK